MDERRARVYTVVEDPASATALKPWYRQLCTRPWFQDEYLQAYNNPDVTLVDTDGAVVERIDESGLWVGGVHYEVDCLVFASGFEVNISPRARYATIGRDGATEASQRIAEIVSQVLATDSAEVEATAEAEQAWVDQLDVQGSGFIGNADCTPGYYNNEAGPPGHRERLNAARYPEGHVGHISS